MHSTTLRKVGGSVMLAVPPAILEMLELDAGGTVGLTVAEGRMVMEPRPRKRYTLEELLAECDPNAPLSEGDKEWLNSPPVGRELI